MEIKTFELNKNIETNKKLDEVSAKFKILLKELRSKELNSELVRTINEKIEYLNSISDSQKKLISQIRKKQNTIIRLVEKEAKLLVRNYYRNIWLAIGISAFGLPLGIAFGFAMNNLGFIGIGLPIGMVIGMTVGMNMDKKAKEEGRQLDFE